MKVYFCYEYQKSNDSRTPLRVKKIFANEECCRSYIYDVQFKEIHRLAQIHENFNCTKFIDERIHELEVTE